MQAIFWTLKWHVWIFIQFSVTKLRIVFIKKVFDLLAGYLRFIQTIPTNEYLFKVNIRNSRFTHFIPNVTFLYPLKISENFKLSSNNARTTSVTWPLGYYWWFRRYGFANLVFMFKTLSKFLSIGEVVV